jgi:hypothetical protein
VRVEVIIFRRIAREWNYFYRGLPVFNPSAQKWKEILYYFSEIDNVDDSVAFHSVLAIHVTKEMLVKQVVFVPYNHTIVVECVYNTPFGWYLKYPFSSVLCLLQKIFKYWIFFVMGVFIYNYRMYM